MSYARFDDDLYDGQLTEFRKLLSAEVRAQTGWEFMIFQDREHISWGQSWQEVIDETLDTVALLLVIVTPGFFGSEACRAEVARFRQRERDLGRSDLILPLYYISAREIEDPAARKADGMARVIASRQFADWRDLRLEPVDSPTVRKAIAQLASRMTTAFWRTPQAPTRPGEGGQRPTGSATASNPLALLAKDPGRASAAQYQRWPWQPEQPSRGATGLPPASPAPLVQPEPYQPPAPLVQPAPYIPPASPVPPAASAPVTPPQWARLQAPPPSPAAQRPSGPSATSDRGDTGHTPPTALGLRSVLSWPPRRLTMVIGGTLAVLLAAAGTIYAVRAPRPGAAAPAATLTVPGGSVDTVWISPDGKRMAAARTAQASTIYVWNMANHGAPMPLTVPPIKIGTKVYPANIENIAFSADDANLTAVGYPGSTGSATEQSYVLYQWNLATGNRATPWSIVRTSSILSFSNDNSTAVESVKGGANLVTLLPRAAEPSPLTIPGGSGLSTRTSFHLDYNGKRMLYSPKRGTYTVWDFAEGKTVDTWSSGGLDYLSPDGKTALVSYYSAKNTTVYPPPILRDLATKANVTPADPRWQQQLVSSTVADQFVTYSTDGTVITTERAGGKTDLWSAETHKFLLTISDPNYRDDSNYAVVGPGGGEVVIFGQRVARSGYQFRQLRVWDTGLG